MRTALVTGASRGIGAAIARKLAHDGFKVALHFNHSRQSAESLAEEIVRGGGRCSCFQADLSEIAAARELVQGVEKSMGPLHTLVCNAGMILDKPLRFTSLDEWRRVLALNLDAAFAFTKAVTPSMTRQGVGRIVYISSDAGLMGDLMRSAYSASKAGMLGLAKSAARELAPRGITVNVVAPGIIESDMTANMAESRRAKQLEHIPLARFGAPREVAEVVAFLVSDQAVWITGQTLCVDGGLNMRGT